MGLDVHTHKALLQCRRFGKYLRYQFDMPHLMHKLFAKGMCVRVGGETHCQWKRVSAMDMFIMDPEAESKPKDLAQRQSLRYVDDNTLNELWQENVSPGPQRGQKPQIFKHDSAPARMQEAHVETAPLPLGGRK